MGDPVYRANVCSISERILDAASDSAPTPLDTRAVIADT